MVASRPSSHPDQTHSHQHLTRRDRSRISQIRRFTQAVREAAADRDDRRLLDLEEIIADA